MWRKSLVALLMILIAITSTIAWACNVPVFRYALDHWRPDAYRAVILHRGALSPTAQQAVQQLHDAIDKQRLNLSIKQVDVDAAGLDGLISGLGKYADDGAHLLLHYPSDLEIQKPVLSIDLEGKRKVEIDELIDSPLRQELLKRLAAGQSAVWLFLTSGNEQLDATARTTLESELKNLQATLELPKLTDDPEDAIKGGPPLRIEFSMLELPKSDKKEWALRSMLLGSEPDLLELDEPLVFPVFGCGRALWPLVGAGISAENLRESATFVAGACSCQVKEQNPGFDLLVNVDWNELLPWTKGDAGSHNLGQQVQVAETIPIPTGSNMSKELIAMGIGSATTGDSAPPAATAAASSGSMTIIIVAIVAVAVIGLLAFLMTRSKRATA